MDEERVMDDPTQSLTNKCVDKSSWWKANESKIVGIANRNAPTLWTEFGCTGNADTGVRLYAQRARLH